jgi:hypothetical protein
MKLFELNLKRGSFKIYNLQRGNHVIYRSTIDGGLVLGYVMSVDIDTDELELQNGDTIKANDVLSTSLSDWKQIKSKS